MENFNVLHIRFELLNYLSKRYLEHNQTHTIANVLKKRITISYYSRYTQWHNTKYCTIYRTCSVCCLPLFFFLISWCFAFRVKAYTLITVSLVSRLIKIHFNCTTTQCGAETLSRGPLLQAKKCFHDRNIQYKVYDWNVTCDSKQEDGRITRKCKQYRRSSASSRL